MSLAELVRVARGLAAPDLVLKGARIVNTLTAEVETGDVAIFQGVIAGVGQYSGGEEIDLKGRFLSPGFLDGHIHLESANLHPAQFAKAVVPRGTTALVTDLHEVANVAGLAGIRLFLRWARRLPLDLLVMVPSCVPATPRESTGDRLGPGEVARALRWEGVIGLGEMMDFPGVLGGGEALEKVALAQGRVVDGHSPGLSGKDLNAYIATGIASDHESVTLEEGREKLRRGMFLMVREGSSEKNLEALLPLLHTEAYRRCLLVSDDRTAVDLVREGHMDAILRRAVKLGAGPVRAIQMVTINPAQHFRLSGRGAIAPGYQADLVVLDDLTSFGAEMVFQRGKLVARGGEPLFPSPPAQERLSNTVHIKPFPIEALRIPTSKAGLPIIEVVPHQIVTRRRYERPRVEEGRVVADVERDLLKAAVVERHRASGQIGVGLVKGFGLKRGALASSVAHDSHNIVAVGVDDRDSYRAILEIERLQGGLVAVAGGEVLAALPLPLFGLLSPQPVAEVARALGELEAKARELGCSLPSPFSILSFLALPVIPELRLTERGLVDGATGELVG